MILHLLYIVYSYYKMSFFTCLKKKSSVSSKHNSDLVETFLGSDLGHLGLFSSILIERHEQVHMADHMLQRIIQEMFMDDWCTPDQYASHTFH